MRIRTGIRRVTTQMVSSTKRRSGLFSRKNAILSVAQSRNGILGTSTKMSIMNANSVQSSRLARSNYEKLQKSSASLVEQTKLLAEKADEGGTEIASTAAQVVANFNDTLKNLKTASGVLNDYYRQSLKETVMGRKKDLEAIGITVATDGSLSLDKDKLEQADAETVKKVLGSESDFAQRVNAVASRASDNARANMESVSSQYTAAGGLASSYLSKYNFLG